MPERPKLAFLLDRSNDWLAPYVETIIEDLTASRKFDCAIYYDTDALVAQDVVFVLGYTRILSADVLAQNKLNLIIHESDLPAGKGFSPVQWQILEGKRSIRVSLIEAAAEVDAGDIIDQTTMELDGYELWPKIRKKQATATIELIRSFLDKYPSFSRKKQEGAESFYSRRGPKDDRLDETKSLRELLNHFRIADNEKFPVYFEVNGHRYYLKVYPIQKPKS